MKPNGSRAFYVLVAGNLLIVAVIFSVAAAVTYRSLDAQHLSEIEAYQHQLTALARQYVEHVWPLPDPETDRLCKQFAAEAPAEGAAGGASAASHGLPIRLTIIAADGRVLGDSEGDPAHMHNHKTPDRPEVLQALEGRTGQDTRRSETLTKPYRYVAMSFSHGGATAGVVRVAMPVVALSEAEAVIRTTMIWTAVVAVGAFAVVGALANWAWYSMVHRARRRNPRKGPA